ncbi:MAG: thioredoxin domain-containing protein [Flavobacteriaceae bacterium]
MLLLLLGCTKESSKDSKHAYTNDLIHETSPYLLQHAHNPVHWKAWNDASLAKAKEENKLIVISVGYSACHWCHVMEEESFEDSVVANIMNQNFISIKIDREERPDVDQVYMKAVQLMTGSGGWPMNVIALPDGRPVFGGTYFTKEQWLRVLNQISERYKENPASLYEYADKLEEGIKSVGLVALNTEKAVFENSFIDEAVNNWKTYFDDSFGGTKGAPKFMIPNNYHFLLRYAHQNKDKELLKYVENTLLKMSFGGVFDHLEGGFSRYSVDKKWHIPHFEKMLYDNAQLVSLYSDAYALTKNDEYKNVVFKTLEFVQNELTSPEGGFYSSLDADSYTSENVLEEGAYYIWTKEELSSALQDEYSLFSKYYNINEYGYWENSKYVLIRTQSDVAFSKENKLSVPELNSKKEHWKKQLSTIKKSRTKPRLDDKILTSWNSLMIRAYLDAYTVFQKKEYLEIAQKAANFIVTNQLTKEGQLYHSHKEGKSTVNGYLEDYAAAINAFIKLYQVTSEKYWLEKATQMTTYSIENFYDDEKKMFYFASKEDPALVARTVDYTDNVIPSSNSMMAKNLALLSHYANKKEYNSMAIAMLNNVKPEILTDGSSFSNWLDLMLNYTQPFYEVVIVGSDASQKVAELGDYYIPNILVAYSATEDNSPLLENRYIADETYIYVCVNNSCKLPVTTVEKALTLLKN